MLGVVLFIVKLLILTVLLALITNAICEWWEDYKFMKWCTEFVKNKYGLK